MAKATPSPCPNRSPTRSKLTPTEAMIMDCLWTLGKATVREIQESLRPVRRMTRNSVLTMMQLLRGKGCLESQRQGPLDLYHPLVTRRQMGARGLRQALEGALGGSPEALVSQLLESEDINEDQLRAIGRDVGWHLQQDTPAAGARP